MNVKQFQDKSIQCYIETLKEKYNQDTNLEDVNIVWFCYILGEMKCLIADKAPNGLYAECTYNKDKKEMYLDIYKKEHNILIKEEE